MIRWPELARGLDADGNEITVTRWVTVTDEGAVALQRSAWRIARPRAAFPPDSDLLADFITHYQATRVEP